MLTPAPLTPTPLTPALTSRVPRFVRSLLLASLFVAASALPSRAAEPKMSLEFVPADAHVYVSISHLGAHAKAIARSNWWAEVQKNEVFRGAIEGFMPKADADVELPAAAIILSDLADLPLYSLAGEMASEEIFFYSDRRAVDLLELYGEASENMVVTYMGISFMFATGQFDFFNDNFENTIAERMLRPVRDNLDKIAVPHVVVGFKIKDPKNAEKVLAQQVDRFREMLADFALPAPSDKVLEETVDGANCWIWRFDGESIPWPAVFDLHGDVPPAFEPVFARLRELKGVVTLCVHDGYVLLGVADSPAWIEKLGEGELLAYQEDLAPLQKVTDKPITGICYASRAARTAWSFGETDLRNIAKSIKQELEAANVSAAIAKDVGRAVDGLADDLRPHLPRPGSTLTAAYRTGDGVEFHTYDRSEPIHADGSKPLTVLDHVGPAPVAFWAGRAKGVEECYRALSKTFAGGYDLIEKHVFPAMQPEIQTQVRPFFDRMKPVAKRFDRAMRDLCFPPLDGGDSALVLTARLTNNALSDDGPPSPLEFPIPLPSVVHSVKDVDQLHAGVKELHAVFNDAAAAYAEVVPFVGEAIKLEEPKSREFAEGTIYWHVLPKEFGVDKRVAPNYGFADNLAVFSLVPLDTRDMLGKSTLELPAPLHDRDQPLAAATYIDVPRACEIVGGAMILSASTRYEWVEEVHTDEDGLIHREGRMVRVQADVDAQAKTLKELIALAKAVPSYSSATKIENDLTITHGVLRIVDLPAATPTEPAPIKDAPPADAPTADPAPE